VSQWKLLLTPSLFIALQGNHHLRSTGPEERHKATHADPNPVCGQEKIENAENQNKPIRGEAIQADRNRQGGVFQIPWKPFLNPQDTKAETVSEKEPDHRQEQYEGNSIAAAQQVDPKGDSRCE
jgi:hypothetical protein